MVLELEDRMRASGALAEFRRRCGGYILPREWTGKHLDIAHQVLKEWHTTERFNVGDKVYVVPQTPTTMTTCTRATVIEVGTDGWGYRLRAFTCDLPGIFMFNMWDKDMISRTSRKQLPVPQHLRITL